MALPLAKLPAVLRMAGLIVIEHPGWATRERTDGPFAPRAVVWHHDASAPGPSPGVPAFMINPANNGAQLWVDTSGFWHIIAAGRMWHAGTGIARGVIRANLGNVDAIGIETDHTIGEPWPDALLTSLRIGTAAILRWLGAKAGDALWGHKEIAPGRKPDPDGLNMAAERTTVAALMKDPPPAPVTTREGLLSALTDVEQRTLFNRVMGWCRQRWYVRNPNGSITEVPEGTKGAIPAVGLDTLDGNYLVSLLGDDEAKIINAVRAISSGSTDVGALAAALAPYLPTGMSPQQYADSVRVELSRALSS